MTGVGQTTEEHIVDQILSGIKAFCSLPLFVCIGLMQICLESATQQS